MIILPNSSLFFLNHVILFSKIILIFDDSWSKQKIVACKMGWYRGFTSLLSSFQWLYLKQGKMFRNKFNLIIFSQHLLSANRIIHFIKWIVPDLKSDWLSRVQSLCKIHNIPTPMTSSQQLYCVLLHNKKPLCC